MRDKDYAVFVPNELPPIAFGAWLYGPMSEFPKANAKELPPHIKHMEFGRVGFVTNMDLKLLGDTIDLCGITYDLQEVKTFDFLDHHMKIKIFGEGFLLCPHLDQSSSLNPSNEESTVQLPNSALDGDNTTQSKTIDTDAL